MKSLKIISILTFAFIISFGFSSCSSDDENSGSTPINRNVKYEITGDFTGKFLIVYSDENGAAQSVDGTLLPWTKEISLITANTASFSSQSTTAGMPGQTATAKLIVNGETKRTETKTADELGRIIFSNLNYTF